jgi:GNAT superfamily N-acetyltransferase
MSETQLDNSPIEEILETQEESEEDDEIIFKLFVNEKLVSWAKTLLYSFLKKIHTAHAEKRKGYGRKLLTLVEKNAKAHGATTMKTTEIDTCSAEAISYFIKMGYQLKPTKNDLPGFLEGTKRL